MTDKLLLWFLEYNLGKRPVNFADYDMESIIEHKLINQ